MSHEEYSHDTPQNRPSLQYQSPPRVYVEQHEGPVAEQQQPNGVGTVRQQNTHGPEIIIDPVYQVCVFNGKKKMLDRQL